MIVGFHVEEEEEEEDDDGISSDCSSHNFINTSGDGSV